jgi:hypothetical protein
MHRYAEVPGGEGDGMSGWFRKAPHTKSFHWLYSYLCGMFTGHRGINYSDGRIHYAYCKWCNRIFGNEWGGAEKAAEHPSKDVMDFRFTAQGWPESVPPGEEPNYPAPIMEADGDSLSYRGFRWKRILPEERKSLEGRIK